jgi:hypothetical protein
LGLIFGIPGIYLEWPSDPWEHLRRINEWHVADSVTAHSVWMKSSYFLPYSLTGRATGLAQLSWLNLYYTAACMLLSWQYYRLARAAGLGERAAFIFVLLNALTFGNNVFSFYRYYGLSSSIFAQIAAVALTRVVIEAARGTGQPVDGRRPSLFFPVPLVATVTCLIGLIAFNHVQALGVAGFGILATAVWRLIEWRRRMIGWLALAAVLASVAVILWLPRHPAVATIYRPQGWLTAAYAFNLFAPGSPAFERSFHILGLFGVLNLVLGLWLVLRQNHLTGWLTMMPVLVFALPCFALPFSVALAKYAGSPDNILVFHRLLLSIPMGLSVAAAFALFRTSRSPLAANPPVGGSFALLPAALLGLLVLSPGPGGYNRFWQSVQIVPDDLQLKPVVSLWSASHHALAKGDDTLTVIDPLGARIRDVFFPIAGSADLRQIRAPLADDQLEQQLSFIHFAPGAPRGPAAREPDAANQLPDWVSLPLPPDRLSTHPIARGSAWQAVAGDPPRGVRTSDGAIVSRTRPGAASYLFDSHLIPLDRGKRYRLTASLRQMGSRSAINYLAVAWHDKSGRMLEANKPAPDGAGAPLGWPNGIYSYYGLVGQPGTTGWSTYSIDFGWGEHSAIPPAAFSIRLGALLNYNAEPGAQLELKDVTLLEKPAYTRVVCALPKPLSLYSTFSLAAFLSGHWSPQKVAEDHAGLTDLRAAARERFHDRVSTASAPGGG